MDRRTFLALGGAGLAGVAFGCGSESSGPADPHRRGLLSARPGTPTTDVFAPGKHVLALGLPRDPVFYLPPDHDARVPTPLVVLYHGAGGSADNWASPYTHADRLGLALLLMQSGTATWDAVRGSWGHDVANTDYALGVVFERCAVDPLRVCFGGFSDGATYALSLGLSNPELVRHVIAFSPGFERASKREPKPRVFISHGTQDTVLPIATTSREIVPQLRAEGYDVTYTEFAGGHEVPPDISRAAFDWLVEAAAASVAGSGAAAARAPRA